MTVSILYGEGVTRRALLSVPHIRFVIEFQKKNSKAIPLESARPIIISHTNNYTNIIAVSYIPLPSGGAIFMG